MLCKTSDTCDDSLYLQNKEGFKIDLILNRLVSIDGSCVYRDEASTATSKPFLLAVHMLSDLSKCVASVRNIVCTQTTQTCTVNCTPPKPARITSNLHLCPSNSRGADKLAYKTVFTTQTKCPSASLKVAFIFRRC